MTDMSIHQVSRNRVTKMPDLTQTLTPGQILRGKVLKLFPDNKAQLKLGSQVLYAQLAASLSVGEDYHFQVQNLGDVIHLKVLGDEVETKSPFRSQVIELMKQLDLNPKKAHTDFLQTLMKDDVRFSRSQLIKAFELIDRSANKQVAQQTIKELFTRNLPITQSIYDAFKAIKTNTLTENLNQLQKQLNQINLPDKLESTTNERISSLLGRASFPQTNTESFMQHFLRHALYKDEAVFNLLKINGAINQDITFSTWNTEWEAFMNSEGRQNQMMCAQTSYPFAIIGEKMDTGLQHLQSTTTISKQAQMLLNNWATAINITTLKQIPLLEENFSILKREITEQLMPQLTNQQQEQVNTVLKNNVESLPRLLTLLRTLATNIPPNLEQIIAGTRQQNINNQLPLQHQFVSQVKQFLQFSGLTHEHTFVQDEGSTDLTTLKPLLIQLVNSDSVVQERAQQALHLLNGLQLQSVNDTSNFIQANMQIPSEKFGLNRDMLIEFESKKSPEGKINQDYCRILFYLDLANLQETVIDMNIQKRNVSITVYNDHKDIKNYSLRYEDLLKEGLESLDYKLTNVSVQPLTKKRKQNKKIIDDFNPTSYEGFDYLV